MANETSAQKALALAMFVMKKPYATKDVGCYLTMPTGGKVTTTIGRPVPESSFKIKGELNDV